MKEHIHGKFQTVSLWNDKERWTGLQALFKKACERSWLEDNNVVDNLKSEPLHCDLSRGAGEILHQKYLDIELVDAVTIAKSMI
jgi:hypothetical protein